jgi:hypothetical protein
VGHGGAICALDRELGAAVAAVDGEPKLRRRSGEVWWSEQERMSEMCVCKRKSKWARSSRMCLGSRRGCGCMGAGGGTPAEDVAARAAAAQRGKSRGVQHGVGKAAARRGKACGSVQCGAEAAGVLHMAGKSGGGASGSETEEEEGR